MNALWYTEPQAIPERGRACNDSARNDEWSREQLDPQQFAGTIRRGPGSQAREVVVGSSHI